MATVVQVASRKYKRAGVIYEIPYFAEDSTGYPDCASLVSLDVPHKVCRAKVVGGTLTRMYAGLVPVSDPRASARRRYVAGIGELAYMKGTYGVYTRSRLYFNAGGEHALNDVIKFSKRLTGDEPHNMYITIRGTGGRGYVKRVKSINGSVVKELVQSLDFDEKINVYATHEWNLQLDTGDYVLQWTNEFLGGLSWCYAEYPSDTLA